MRDNEKWELDDIEEAVADLKKGKMIILLDSEDRENEGDLVIASEFVTPQAINFMTKYGRGLVCVVLTKDRLKRLNIPLMVPENTALHGTAFTVSVDYTKGTTTGISAYDRARTIKALIDPNSRPDDFARPGHVFPLMYQEGGVLVRPGQTEGSIDLVRMAGLYPSAVICEIMDDDGKMMRMPKLKEFARKHNLKIVSIPQLIRYRKTHEILVEKVSEADLPTRYGHFRIFVFQSLIDSRDHVALVKGDITTSEPVLVRIHSECLTGDTFGSLRCDCGDQLHTAMKMIENTGRGMLVYLRQEGRGIGLRNKIKAYALQDQGLDTVEANIELGFAPDLRDYHVAAHIMRYFGIKDIKLLTNNPSKMFDLAQYGINIVERVPIVVEPNKFNIRYLKTKRDKMGHLIDFEHQML